MKKVFLLMVLVLGLALQMPPPAQASSANDQGICFVDRVNHFSPAAVMVQDYVVDSPVNFQQVSTLDCRKGGGVVIQELKLDTQPTNLIAQKVTKFNFNQYCRYDLRLCYSTQLSQKCIQKNIVTVYPVRIRDDTSV